MARTVQNQPPQHVAFILDGNGRWARLRKKTVTEGHKKGVNTLEDIIEHANKLGIRIVTLYAFSSENWKRSEQEKKVLFQILKSFFRTRINRIIKNNIRLKIIGDTKRFSPAIRQTLKDSEKRSSKNDGTLIQIALSYGGRDEIIRAVKKSIRAVKSGKMNQADINEESFKKFLDTGDCPDPDLLIRTGGDMRISNFLLYQLAYTELYITPVLWPDFNAAELEKAIKHYMKRERRFGGRI